MVWYSHLFQNFPQFIVIHTVKGFDIVNKAEVDVFLELSCFFHDPADVVNLISGSSAFSKTSLNIWKFTVHVLLKPGLQNFEITLLATSYVLCISLMFVDFSVTLSMTFLCSLQVSDGTCPICLPGSLWIVMTRVYHFTLTFI